MIFNERFIIRITILCCTFILVYVLPAICCCPEIKLECAGGILIPCICDRITRST